MDSCITSKRTISPDWTHTQSGNLKERFPGIEADSTQHIVFPRCPNQVCIPFSCCYLHSLLVQSIEKGENLSVELLPKSQSVHDIRDPLVFSLTPNDNPQDSRCCGYDYVDVKRCFHMLLHICKSSPENSRSFEFFS